MNVLIMQNLRSKAIIDMTRMIYRLHIFINNCLVNSDNGVILVLSETEIIGKSKLYTKIKI